MPLEGEHQQRPIHSKPWLPTSTWSKQSTRFATLITQRVAVFGTPQHYNSKSKAKLRYFPPPPSPSFLLFLILQAAILLPTSLPQRLPRKYLFPFLYLHFTKLLPFSHRLQQFPLLPQERKSESNQTHLRAQLLFCPLSHFSSCYSHTGAHSLSQPTDMMWEGQPRAQQGKSSAIKGSSQLRRWCSALGIRAGPHCLHR